MSCALAEALLPGVILSEYTPLSYCDALISLAEWALWASPFVSIDDEIALYKKDPLSYPPPSSLSYGITLDITGTERCQK